MTDVPKEVEAIAKQMWERALKETAKVMGIAGEQSDKLIAVQGTWLRRLMPAGARRAVTREVTGRCAVGR